MAQTGPVSTLFVCLFVCFSEFRSEVRLQNWDSTEWPSTLPEVAIMDTHFQGVAFSLSILYNPSTSTLALMSGHFKAGEPNSDQGL